MPRAAHQGLAHKDWGRAVTLHSVTFQRTGTSTQLLCFPPCGHSVGEEFLLLALENEGPKSGSSNKKTEQPCLSSG